MADQKITQLTNYTTPQSADILPIVDISVSTTKKVTMANLMNVLSTLFRVKDNSDTTKQVAFDVSGVTTGTTRTLKIPNENATIVGDTATQTLTNKTISTGTKINTSGSDGTGAIYYRDASGNLTHLDIGTNGQLLQSDGTKPTWIPNLATFKNFGDGSDGDVTISAGTTTLTRDMYYNNLVITGTLKPDGYRIFVKGTISGGGVIDYSGNNGGNATTYTAGTAGTAVGSGIFKGVVGKVGASGSSSSANGGNSGNNGDNGRIGGTGAKGGNSVNSYQTATGGTAGTNVQISKPNIEWWQVLSLKDIDYTLRLPCGSGSGASGGTNVVGGSGYILGAGGGSGSTGGTIMLFASNFTGTFTIQALGGNGGNGGNSSGGDGRSLSGGGGGAGGTGGIAMVVYNSKSWTGSYILTGGTGGNGGTGAYGGNTGQSGATSAGTYYELLASNLV